MDLSQMIKPGMTEESTWLVESKHAAPHIGQDGLQVLATPWLIGMMENTAHRLLARYIPAGYSSVGVVVNIRHLAPTPLGGQVRIQVEVLEVDGIKAMFAVCAWDDGELIGEGQHQRMVIDEERFFKRVAAKNSQLTGSR